MGRLEELKQKYPVKDVAPYGSCIVVPGSEFNPDWEADLEDQGISIVETDFGDPNMPVTLVQVKKQVGVMTPSGELWSSDEEKRLLKRMNEISGSLAEKISMVTLEFPGRTPIAVKKKYEKLRHAVKAVTPSQAQRTSSKTRVMFDPESRWTDSEKDLLAKLWNQKLKVLEIMPKFPNRSEASIRMELARLIKDGVIRGRWKKGGKRDWKRLERPPQKTEKPTEKKKEEVRLKVASDTPSSIPEHTPTSAQKDTPVRNAPEQPTERSVCFEAYCRKCGDRRSVQDDEVWICCPVCGGPLIIWNVVVQEEAAE
jgi:hypothetical protein